MVRASKTYENQCPKMVVRDCRRLVKKKLIPHLGFPAFNSPESVLKPIPKVDKTQETVIKPGTPVL